MNGISMLAISLVALSVSILILVFIIAVQTLQRYRRKANLFFEYLPRHIWNTASLQKLVGSPLPLPPPTGWAADSDLLVELSRLVALNKPNLVVELGSGLSTVVIAATLRSNGSGRVISVEHDASYAHSTQQSLKMAGLDALVEIRVAALEEQRGVSSTVWYGLSDESFPELVDLVFVDGPPAELGNNIRESALNYFWPRLAANGSLIFDDARRPEENTFIERWLRGHPEALIQHPLTLKGCAIISKSSP
ncbi:class I SAM-dependent methyltransferase [Luteimonas sp. MJ246]|uniref:O-methyltransferase n=1 Tax=Luteimonas sp. MJ174 TaxID=3129237 RepID=UPI0031BBBF07